MKNERSTPFGERLKLARKKAKLTQQAAAKKVGMSQGTLAELENEGQGSSYTAALADLYDVDSFWLATGKGTPDPKRPKLQMIQSAKQTEIQGVPDEVIELLALFQQATESGRENILAFSRSTVKSGLRWRRIAENDS